MNLFSPHIQDELAPGTSVELAQANLKLLQDNPAYADHVDFNRGSTEPAAAEELETGRRFLSVSGLSAEHVRKAVNMTLQAAVLGMHHAPAIHYTQGDQRWQGIDADRKAWRGEFPTEADCSAYGTWCLWNGLDHFHHSDTVNGERWRGGYTGTLLQHGRRVSKLQPGDLVIYGTSWPGEHTAVYTGGGLVVSHGGEIGPLLVPYNYRSDILSLRRYI